MPYRIGEVGLAIALCILGTSVFIIGHEHNTPFHCSTQGPPNCFADQHYEYWGAPVELAGLILSVIGIAWAIIVVWVSQKSKKDLPELAAV